MRWFRNISIRNKLMTGFMLTTLVTLLIAVGLFAVYDRNTFRQRMIADVSVLAGVVGENISSAIVFNDRETATETLAALRAQPRIMRAWVFDANGKPFARYLASAVEPIDVTAPPPDGARYMADTIDVARPLTFNEARVGTVYLQSDLREARQRIVEFAWLMALVLLGTSIVALLLASFFQRLISQPIVDLLKIEQRVTREKDYSVRAIKKSEDEVGALIDGFNEMLTEIRTRDAEIIEQHNKEMALAKTIQTSVLPNDFAIPGFEVAAIMLPAQEVGGDFYEFRPTPDGGAWLGMGDVTGHGLSSGLVMMMAQSMFTLLCEQNGNDGSPGRFISLLNRAMTYNLKKRLRQDRFMTMMIARLRADGTMTLAGAHTDMLVYRASRQSVERIPTEGIWLGIRDDIEEATIESELGLAAGDVLLLHTDGATEARNAQGICFDMDRLTESFRGLADETAETIVTTLASQTLNWSDRATDDISLMAIKRI